MSTDLSFPAGTPFGPAPATLHPAPERVEMPRRAGAPADLDGLSPGWEAAWIDLGGEG